jgi:molybdopterin-containing oxidoreductase family membrane subunit
MGAAGKRTPQMWAMYITTFVFWIGIGHAGTLISAVLYLFRAKWRTSIYRGAEAMTVFAVMTPVSSRSSTRAACGSRTG